MRLPAALLALLLLAACGNDQPKYDEAAHRAEVEQLLGHPVKDWPTVLRISRENCDGTEKELRATLAEATEDRNRYEVIAIGVHHLCPDRDSIVDELDQQSITITPTTIPPQVGAADSPQGKQAEKSFLTDLRNTGVPITEQSTVNGYAVCVSLSTGTSRPRVQVDLIDNFGLSGTQAFDFVQSAIDHLCSRLGG